jgi:nicotinamidase-related amidase
MSDALSLDPKTTALVVIDLQKGIAGRETSPHPAAQVIAKSAQLAERFRARGAPVVLVRVSFAADGADRPPNLVDAPMPAGPMPAGFDEIVPEMKQQPGDLLITKRQWGAFHDTGLDTQLRRRGVKTIVLTGIATNFGVESTARAAHEHNYGVVLAEDAMSSLGPDAHAFAVKTVFPRLGRVRSTDEVLKALEG